MPVKHVKWKSFDDDPPPEDQTIFAYGRAPWDQDPEDDGMHIAAIRYNRENRRWYMDGTRMPFSPIKWTFPAKK